MKNIQILITSGLTALLFGCSHYQPPSDGPIARIQFIGDHNFVYIGKGPVRSCENRSMLDIESWEGTYIPATGQRVWIQQSVFYAGAMTLSCELEASFIPERGEIYVSEYKFDNMACAMNIYRIDASGERHTELSTKQESWPLHCFY